MLAMRLVTVMLSILLCNASPLLRRQRPSQSPSPNPSLTRLAAPSPSAPSQSAPELVLSQSGSAEPSASVPAVSVGLSVSQSASATASIVSSSVSPSPSVDITTPKLSAPIVTDDPVPSVVVNPLPMSSVTRIITALPSASVGPKPEISGNTSKNFWENQSAVIATFIIVGVAALVLLGIVVYFLRRRAIRKEQESLDDGFFEKFNDVHSDRAESRVGHSTSPDMSVDLHSHQPMTVRDYGNNALAPHLAFSGQSHALYQHYQDPSNYIRMDERSLDRPGSGDSFYGANPSRAHRGY